ncbi:MAG: hypothetical protein QXS62_07515 [Sulfolobales archaeon]
MGRGEPPTLTREVKVVGTALTLVLALIALIAMVEKGPPAIAVYRGASPLNTGPIGTFELLKTLKDLYPQTASVRSYDELDQLFRGADRCLFITVSPEVGYTGSEAEEVVRRLRTCRQPAVLVADENVTSNALLEALGSSARVSGELVRSPITGLPYATALITLPNGSSHLLLLDKASSVLAPQHLVVGVAEGGEPVMALEDLGWVRVAVLGDGSLLLNQVLTSNVTSYREMVLELIDYLCGGSSDCRIALDGSRYESVDVEVDTLEKALELPLYADPLTLAVLRVLRAIHPAYWFPPLVSYVNSLVEYAKSLAYVAPALVLATTVAVYMYASGRVRAVSDGRLEEQREVEVYLTGELRDTVMRGRVSLDKGDFTKLFELVDSVVRLTYGVGLCDPDAAKVLPVGDSGSRYVRDMCRLYDKASGRRRLPIVLSWNRTTRRMIRRSDEFLKSMGQSLTKERGVEYALLR